jgi:hypothetical protein
MIAVTQLKDFNPFTWTKLHSYKKDELVFVTQMSWRVDGCKKTYLWIAMATAGNRLGRIQLLLLKSSFY